MPDVAFWLLSPMRIDFMRLRSVSIPSDIICERSSSGQRSYSRSRGRGMDFLWAIRERHANPWEMANGAA